jgi:hypothetical protein
VAARTWAADRADREGAARNIFTVDAMAWLADTDVDTAYGFTRAILDVRTEAELRRRVLDGLAGLVPADVLT